MAKKRHDLLIGIGVMLFSLFVFFYSFNFSKFNREGTLPFGPRFYPQLIGIGLFICGLILAIKSKPFQISIPKEGMKNNMKIILLFVGYIFCFEFLGYIISTFIFIFALVYSLYFRAGRKLFHTIIFSGILTTCMYITFYTLLKIPLPGGLLGHKLF